MVVGAQGPAASEDRNGLYRERHNMRLLHLHASSGDRPDTVLQIELWPHRQAGLTGAHCSADGEEQSIAPGRGGKRAESFDEARHLRIGHRHERSEEHTSELQSLMRISYAVFCL